MSELCCVCKKNIPYIHIEGDGDYCRECHNQKMLDVFGIKNDFYYSNKIRVSDIYGGFHTFVVEHIILGSIVSWEAREVNGYYKFSLISNITDNGSEVAYRFFQKIAEGVNNKTINKEGYNINDKGNIRIIYDEDSESEIQFVIDGMKISPNELAEIFKGFEEFNIQFRVCDPSDPLLGKDEYLVPVKITSENLIEELEYIINVYSDRGFMDYKRVSLFEEYYFKFIHKLEVLYDNKREEAVKAGKKMIEMLEQIEHDDDWFPITEVSIINDIITKYD